MKKIVLGCYVVGMIQTNFYYLHREGEKETIVFDPADYGKELYEELTKQGLTVKAIFLTHGHFDHIYGVEALRKASGAPVYASAFEKELLLDPELNTSIQYRSCTVTADRYLIDGESVTEAGIRLTMLSTPGHTEGSCCYYIEAKETGDEPILLSGDTLFEGSVGRTDLPTGDMHDLVDSIRTKLYVLPDNTQVYSGHGGPTSIGYEKKHNYFVTV
ncbi:MAG TPA: MBL fold metallo-hydrolase [Lachnospiraceae bacterium]|nr:MBL fold metallo-hydrolase [Lachnospiraceae bacterium]